MKIKYSIFDPSGNITALVETRVETENQPEAADEIMKIHPEVEQVGFVYFEPMRSAPVFLRMAGGEFCGNATMSAAALYLMRSGEDIDSVKVVVSGIAKPIEVGLSGPNGGEGGYEAVVSMPPAIEIGKFNFKSKDRSGELPVVAMEGISHVLINPDSGFYELKDRADEAEAAVRDWCRLLGADCLGLMFYESEGEKRDKIILTPLVYVPGADTMFWENSCASGSTALAMYMSDAEGGKVSVSMDEPGGVLRAESDLGKAAKLYGHTLYVSSGEIEI